jgi:putative tryptophan/tyrosine transport system substrate-binding protein
MRFALELFPSRQKSLNPTGVTFLLDELASKRLELLKQAVWDSCGIPITLTMTSLKPNERELKPLAVRGPADFDGAFMAATQARVDALYVVSSRLTLQNLGRIVNFAAENRLPLAAALALGPNSMGCCLMGQISTT